MSEPGEAVSVSSLRELVGNRYVVELLDALSKGPMSFVNLRSHVGGDQRRLALALRLVGARGVVTRSDVGSWDTASPGDAVYRLTDRGQHVLKALSNLSVWTAMYGRADAATDHSWKR